MRKLLYWFVAIIMLAVVAGLWHSDYCIVINGRFSLISDGDGAVLVDDTVEVIGHVVGYSAVNHSIVGRSRDGYFIVTNNGDVMAFASHDRWIDSVKAMRPDFKENLTTPSRYQDGLWRTIAMATIAALAAWLAIGFLFLRNTRRRHVHANFDKESRANRARDHNN